jgi:hypothetical protein
MSPPWESRPEGTERLPESTPADTTDYTSIPGYQPTEAPTVEDRADAEVVAAAAARGYRLSTTCVHCGHWVSDPKMNGDWRLRG